VTLSCGAARSVITPPLGVSLAGSYTDRRAARVDGDLYARALVLESDGTALAVVACDLIGVRASTVAGARRLIAAATGIPAERVLVHGTHNHSGPLTREPGAGGLTGETDEPYLHILERQIASAVQGALSRLEPCRLRLTVGVASGIAFNRRFVMEAGPVRTNPGKLNPAVREPAALVDERVWTLCVLPPHDGGAESAAAVPPATAPRAALVSFALHPAIAGGTAILADFPAALESAFGRLTAADGAPAPVVVFGNAPCGDVNHVDVSHDRPQTGAVEAARVGTVLAAAAGASACRLLPDWEAAGEGVRLDARAAPADLPLRRPSDEEIAWARAVVAGDAPMSMVPGRGLEVVEAHRIVSLADLWTGATHATEVQAFAVGEDLAIVGLPGEIFAELGLDLRRRSPYRHTLVFGLSNEAIGYVPTRRAYAEGGYEPASSRLQPGSGEHLVELALDILGQLKRKGG
jgi:hypothetical protein